MGSKAQEISNDMRLLPLESRREDKQIGLFMCGVWVCVYVSVNERDFIYKPDYREKIQMQLR